MRPARQQPRRAYRTTRHSAAPAKRGRGVEELLLFVGRIQAARAQRAADLRDLRLETALTEVDELVRQRPG